MKISRVQTRIPLLILISIVILFLAGLSVKTLLIFPVPSRVSPIVEVTVAFPDAKANFLADSVLVRLEEAINDVPNIHYMAFAATPFGSAGEATILILFEPGTDQKAAVLNVQNRIQKVKNGLTPAIEAEGISVTQPLTSMLIYVKIDSTDEGYDQNFLYNFSVNVLPEIKRVRGIGSATILGNRQRTMRLRLDLERMDSSIVSLRDVMNAMPDSSMIGPAEEHFHEIGRTPQTIEYALTWIGRYHKPEQYENLILRATPDGELIRLKDIAELELVPVYPSYYNIGSAIDGHPSAVIVLMQLAGTNSKVVVADVKKKLEEIKVTSFPPGMVFDVSDEFPASWRLPRNRSKPQND